METYFIAEPPQGGRVAVSGYEARHICRVLRHRPGDRVAMTDGNGMEYDVRLNTVGPRLVTGEVLGARQRPREPRYRVALAQAVLKGDRLAQSCEQAAELGATDLYPLRTSRTIGRLGAARLERLRSVALSGMKSAGGSVLLRVHEARGTDELASELGRFGQALVAYEDERRETLGGVVEPGRESYLVIIGPEGGFEPDEVRSLRSAGAVSFSLGPRRLRSETAATVAVASLMQLLGESSPKDQTTLERGGAIGSW